MSLIVKVDLAALRQQQTQREAWKVCRYNRKRLMPGWQKAWWLVCT